MRKQVLLTLFLLVVTLTLSAQWNFQESEGTARIPAYHAGPPQKGEKLPPLLPKEVLLGQQSEYAFQGHAYELAAKIPNLLYQ